MINKFEYTPKSFTRGQRMVQALLQVADSLITLFSLGTFWGSYAYEYSKKCWGKPIK